MAQSSVILLESDIYMYILGILIIQGNDTYSILSVVEHVPNWGEPPFQIKNDKLENKVLAASLKKSSKTSELQ